MQEVVQLALAYHKHRDLPVLINGETGTGKEIIAKMVHQGEESNTKPYISVNCSAINTSLFESELFGYEKGAFTGAVSSGSIGKLEMAQGGTIFFDEIGDLPLDLQPKLLRVLQEKEFYRVQGKKSIKLDVRFIFATNIDLRESITQNKFRQDLYYRINFGSIIIPPLRERIPEIGMLALLFLKEASSSRNKSFKTISHQALEILEANPWYGNIRELKSVIDRVVLLYDDSELQSSHLQQVLGKTPNDENLTDNSFSIKLPDDFFPINELEYELANTILKKFKGNISRSARYLDVSFRRFKRMAKLN
jgi:transcriptional regulator with PAS, ATPase and Fis domain